ncbi:MAG TPA: amidohydrolase family protein [Kribbella sp.]
MTETIDGHRHLGRGVDMDDTLDHILADMDEHGVSRTVLIPADREIAVDNQRGNDAVLVAADAHPERLLPMATVNPWFGDRAVAELSRAVGNGAVGLKLHPALQGFVLCHPMVHPVVAECQALGVPVYVHTGTPPYAQPLQLVELARTFPEVTFVMGHAGSTDLKADAQVAAEMAPNVVVETSWSLPARLRQLVEAYGADRVMFGSDAPLSYLGLELANHRAAELPAADAAAVMGGTARRVFGGMRRTPAEGESR